jgi:hypothetical protein
MPQILFPIYIYCSLYTYTVPYVWGEPTDPDMVDAILLVCTIY